MLQQLRPMGNWGLSGMGQASNLVSSMAAAIAQMEGTNPAFANNFNVGNLIYIGPNQNGQTGVTPGAGGFAKFTSPASGQAALANQIQYQINQGQTLTQFFNQYAPGGTTNAAGGVQTSAATQNYINFVSNQLGIDPSIPLNQIAASYTGPGSVLSADTGTDGTSTTDSAGEPTSLGDVIGGIDLTDPTTLVAIGVAGAALMLYALS